MRAENEHKADAGAQGVSGEERPALGNGVDHGARDHAEDGGGEDPQEHEEADLDARAGELGDGDERAELSGVGSDLAEGAGEPEDTEIAVQVDGRVRRLRSFGARVALGAPRRSRAASWGIGRGKGCVDRVAQAHRRRPRGSRKIGALRSVEDGSRGRNEEARAPGVDARREGSFEVAALSADAGDEDGKGGAARAHGSQRRWVGGADDEAAVAVFGAPFHRELRNTQVERLAAHVEILQIGGARIGGATEYEGGAVRAGEKGAYRVAAHIGADRDGIRAKLVEGGPWRKRRRYWGYHRACRQG